MEPARTLAVSLVMRSTHLALVVLLSPLSACDAPASCEQPRAARVVFEYECGELDEQVQLAAWGPEAPTFVGAVAVGCSEGVLAVELVEPGAWWVEAKVGQGTTLECEMVVTSAMVEGGAELVACEGTR